MRFTEESYQRLIEENRKLRERTAVLEAHQNIHKQAEWFGALVENSPDIIYVADAEGKLLFINRAFPQNAKEDAVGEKIYDFSILGDRELIQQNISRIFDAKRVCQFESQVIGPEEKISFYENHYLPIMTDGEISALIGVTTDITDRRIAEDRALFSSRIVEQTPDAIICTDVDGKITYLNRAAEEMFGCSLSEVQGKNPEIFNSDPRAAQIQAEIWNAISSLGVYEGEAVNRRKDGSTFICQMKIAPLFDREGKLSAYMAANRDISERKQMRVRLAQSDRLASMGMLAAGVAHEINNPLTYVLYNLSSLAEGLPQLEAALAKLQELIVPDPEEEKRPHLSQKDREHLDPSWLQKASNMAASAHEGGTRIREIVNGLSTFSRVDEDPLMLVDLQSSIEVAINMVFNEIKYRGRLVRDYQEISGVIANQGKLAQVFLNLLVNAAQAIESGDAENNEIGVRIWQDGGEVLAEVRDTGSGIAAEQIPKLFDPFFTTKEIGVGTGLGLSISKNLVENFGGTIEVRSEIDKGSRFVIRLPVPSPETLRRFTEPEEAAHEETVRGRILVVDDEKHIRAIMTEILSEHDVVEADSGRAGLNILEHDQKFDLILCDVMMPDLSGIDLHKWLCETHPALANQMVFVTGGAFIPTAKEYLGKVDNLSLKKPFDVGRFKKTINDAVQLAQK